MKLKARCIEVVSSLDENGEVVTSVTLAVEGFDENVGLLIEPGDEVPAVGQFFSLTLTKE